MAYQSVRQSEPDTRNGGSIMQMVDFFIGANSPDGFVSFFNQLTDPELRSFLLKGGPGTGKSTMIERAIESARCGGIVEQIHCSSDPDSLDGALFHEPGIAIADATSPHVLSPNYPGAVETEVSLFECFDSEPLVAQKEQIISLFSQKKSLSRRCQNFLHAANTLLNDSFYIALENTDLDKVHRCAMRLCAKELPQTGNQGKEHRRFLSAVTPKGVVTYIGTALELCDRIVVINDEYGCSSRLLLSLIRAHALEAGYEIFTCYCPLNPNDKIDHIFIPALGLGFMTSHRYNKLDAFEPYRVINYTRFTDTSVLKLRKQRLSFNRKASAELIAETISTMGLAARLHSILEAVYAQAMDFHKADEISKKLNTTIAELSGRA